MKHKPNPLGLGTMTVNRDGTGLHQIVKDEAAVAMEPTWSPHGNELIYTDVVMRPDQPFFQLFKTDMSDSRPVQLTNEGDNSDADWFDPAVLPVEPQPQLRMFRLRKSC